VHEELTLRDYLNVLWSGRWLVLALVLVGALVGTIVSVAKPARYTAISRLSLGQATTINGTPVQTPLTSPQTAPSTLNTDAIIREVASTVGVSGSVVRNGVSLTTPRVIANSGNQPTVLTITAKTKKRATAIAVANAYSDAVYAKVNASFRASFTVLDARMKNERKRVDDLNAQINDLRRQLVQSAGTDRAFALQGALYSAVNQLSVARLDAEDAEVAASKAERIEAPLQLVVAESATSSGSAPNRLRAIIFASMLGLLLGVFATFVWKGSPAARARPAAD
jgi:uncharacterized protein involved in exopolysaccharide biosynthesis